MSIELLQTEVSVLSSEQRRQPMAFMVALEDRSCPDYAAELARKIDDQAPDRWLAADQCERKLDSQMSLANPPVTSPAAPAAGRTRSTA